MKNKALKITITGGDDGSSPGTFRTGTNPTNSNSNLPHSSFAFSDVLFPVVGSLEGINQPEVILAELFSCYMNKMLFSSAFLFQASNPGQFESDVELCWQRGAAADSIYHAGRVGVNTDRPDEALVVHGNMKVTGHIVQPSDLRAKRDIQECDSAQQLINVRQLRVVKYRYDPEFSNHCGLDTQSDTGIIAQELRNILPEAVMPAGDVVLPSGTRIDNFLVVNK
ncbi:hypothetical protein J6590_104847, partial [Homalodisca vitripennis]